MYTQNDIYVVMLRFGFIDFDSIFRSTIRSRFNSVSILGDRPSIHATANDPGFQESATAITPIRPGV